MAHAKILVVDDEVEITELLRDYLEEEQYTVRSCADGQACIAAFREFHPDVILLDIMLPGLNGMEVCRILRAESAVPIILLSAKRTEDDKIIGLGLGADDYVVKPFSPREVVARVKAQLRRCYQLSRSDVESGILKFRNVEINSLAYTVCVNNIPIELTAREFEVLHFLALHCNQVLTRQQIYDGVWGVTEYGDLNTVTIHIKKIRNKLDPYTLTSPLIRTVWGIGYKFEGKRL